MAFTDSIEEMMKIYNWGDEEVLKYTGLGSRPEAAIRQNYEEIKARGGNFIDSAFPHTDEVVGPLDDLFDDAQGREALQGYVDRGFDESQGYTWVRLKDYIYFDEKESKVYKNLTPVFSTGPIRESLCRSDISQGSVGNCWFLAALGAISVNAEQFEFCVPADNEYNETGVYHFRFWFQGLYVDVVVDDWIPVFPQNVYGYGDFHFSVGARPVRNGDKLEFWGPLVEKAYAKLQGSYLETVGGAISNGFENITGGFPEWFDLGRETPRDLLDLIKSSLNQSTFLGLGCSHSNGGLVGGHAYSITGHTVVNYRGQKLDLIRIRNPWGRGEWEGPWADKDRKWETLTGTEKANRVKAEDGEFWMTYNDMKGYFSRLHVVASYTVEDFKKAAGKLRVERHFGEWSISKGTASGFSKPWNNPKYEVTVGGSGNKLPLAVSLSRERTLHDKQTSAFLVGKDRLDGYGQPPLTDMYGRNTLAFSRDFQTYGFQVSPGKYVISPMLRDGGVERKFCLRIVYQTS